MDIFKLPVHPLADSFPMLSKWELQELADDIQTNGLSHPLIVGDIDGKRMLIDGRNRREACRMANVTPEVKELNGANAVNLIVSENLMRRNLTVSQRAIFLAKANPEGDQGKATSPASGGSSVGKESMRMARALVNEASDLAEQIISNPEKTVKALYRELEDRRAVSNNEKKSYDILKNEAPDLAELVDGGAKLSEQWGAYQQRLKDEKDRRKNTLLMTAKSLSWFSGLTTKQNRQSFIDCLVYPDEVKEVIGKSDVKTELRSALKVLTKLVEELDNA